jgi:phosphonate transport system permease protein
MQIMKSTSNSGADAARLYPVYRRDRLGTWRKRGVVWVLLAAAFGWSMHGTRFYFSSLIEGAANSFRFLFVDMLPPDFSAFVPALPGLLDTLYMSLFGFVVSVIVSLVLGVMTAKTTTPHPAARLVSKAFIAFIRSIPDVVFAILLVSAFGIGPVPGAIALGIGGVGVLAKLFAESLEEIDTAMLEPLTAVGAGWLQKMGQGVWPQFKTAFTAWSLFRLDLNIRSASVVGLVGAGGLGYSLNVNMSLFQFRQATTIMLMVFVLIISVEFITGKLRERIL